jgi:carbon-monoxide dehydrogenase medium subunit
MLLSEFTYHRARSVADALAALGATPGARPLAGGQTLINAMKLRAAQPAALVDISALEELREIRRVPDGGLQVGAGVTYAQLERDPLVAESHPILAEVAAGTVDVQVRNRGTLGGNACLNDPTGNFPPLLVALDATMRIAGPDGERSVAAEDFFLGYARTAVGDGELLRAVELPPLPAGGGAGYRSLQVAADSWAIARACARVSLAGDTIEQARVVLGCVAPRPWRHAEMERRLAGQPAEEGAVSAAAEAVGDADGLEPVTDAHATSDYRRAMARVHAQRAVLAAIADAQGRSA